MQRFLISVIDSLVDSLPRNTNAPSSQNPIRNVTKRVYTITYNCQLPRVITEWTTEIIDHADGRVECIATPVYATTTPHRSTTEYETIETIETTDVLNVEELLAQDDVSSVTWEERTDIGTSEESTDVESAFEENETINERVETAWAWVTMDPTNACRLHFGLDVAVATWLCQLLET